MPTLTWPITTIRSLTVFLKRAYHATNTSAKLGPKSNTANNAALPIASGFPETRQTTPKQGVSALAFCLALLSINLFINACAIRTSESEHYFGPVLYTTGRHATVQSMSEQLHFPFLIEAGTQWGVSVGTVKRVRSSPLLINEAGIPDSTNQPERLTSLGGIQLSSNLFLSLLYLRATPNQSPEFLARTTIGATLGIGSEQTTLTAGIKQVTELRPSTPGLHYLCFQSSLPERMTYVVTERPESLSQFDCGRTPL